MFQESVVLVAAGRTHAACVTSKGVLFTWGMENTVSSEMDSKGKD